MATLSKVVAAHSGLLQIKCQDIDKNRSEHSSDLTTLCLLMHSFIWFGVVYQGSHVLISKIWFYFVPQKLILSNETVSLPDEMPCSAAVHLSLGCLF